MKKISRVLVLPAALLAVNASAVCPLFQNKLVNTLHQNKNLIGASLTADHMCDKNDHAKKAFICSAGQLANNPNAHALAERFVVDYAIRKGSDAIGLDKYAAAILKTCDVLPEGMIRDNVNPVIKSAVDVVTHPETLTELAMAYVIPQVVQALGKSQSNG